MKVFDFDNTIYDGESSVDFFLFLLEEKKELWKYMPTLVKTLSLYKLNKLKLADVLKETEKISYEVIKNKDYADEYIEKFWRKNKHKLKPNLLKRIDKDDVIITAAPSQLIDGIKKYLNTDNIITSQVNLDTGKVEFLCMRKNKERALRKMYPNLEIDELYTDSMNDYPLMKYAKVIYIIKGNKCLRKGPTLKNKLNYIQKRKRNSL